MALVVIRDPYTGQLTPFDDTRAGYPAASAAISQISGAGLTYLFPYAPVEVQFSEMGMEWEQIERPGDYALVNRRSPKLKRVSFTFRVAHRPTNGLYPITRDLILLSRMADGKESVVVTGLGVPFMGVNYVSGVTTNVAFKITDFSITVVRRSDLNNEPWQADCSMELIEERNPTFAATSLPPIQYELVPVPQTVTGGQSGNGGGSSRPRGTTTPPGGGDTNSVSTVSRLVIVGQGSTRVTYR